MPASLRVRRVDGNEGPIVVNSEQRSVPLLLPFLLGAVVGGFGGAILGTVLGPYILGVFSAAWSLVARAANRSDDDQPKFELLLQ